MRAYPVLLIASAKHGTDTGDHIFAGVPPAIMVIVETKVRCAFHLAGTAEPVGFTVFGFKLDDKGFAS